MFYCEYLVCFVNEEWFSIVADGASEADRPDKPIDGNSVVGC